MPFVVDASVAMCWLAKDEQDSRADAARERISYDTAIAPNLWWFEVRNALIVSERRGRMDRESATAALSLLRELAVGLDTDAAEAALLELARKHRLTVYDAAYLELAKRKGLPLATLDGALVAAANAESVPLIGADA